jgi:hypothetical protein
MSSIAVMFGCFLAVDLIPGTSRVHNAFVLAAAALITCCVIGVFAAGISVFTIRKYGRPRFLIPPRVRRVASRQVKAPWEASADPLTAAVPTEPWAVGEVSLLTEVISAK